MLARFLEMEYRASHNSWKFEVRFRGSTLSLAEVVRLSCSDSSASVPEIW